MAAPDQKQFVLVLVMVPGEHAGEFGQLHFLAVQLRDHLVGERQRRGETRRFDSEQMRETRQPMLRRTFDREIGGRLAGSSQFRAHAGIIRLQ